MQIPAEFRKAALAALVVLTGAVMSNAARADVIAGPTLSSPGSSWSVTGLGFTALENTSLTGFTFQNQGQADTVVLTDPSGDILDTINTPAGDDSYTASVDWSLTSGDTYYLLQTVASNELYAAYGDPLPSDSQIEITLSGVFDYTVSGAASDSQGWGSNEYWGAFNDITTGGAASPVPEPNYLGLMLPIAFALVWGIRRKALNHA